MIDGSPAEVFVAVGPRAATNAADRVFLAAAVARVLGVDRRSVAIEQRCDRCRGRHGRPMVIAPAGGLPLHVSLSRAGRWVAVAVTSVGPVGLDIESIAAVSLASFDDVAFGAEEAAALLEVDDADAGWARASMWTSKEAALKTTGTGLLTDPRELSVAVPRRKGLQAPALTGWRGAALPPGTVHLTHFEPAAGIVGTVAVLASLRPNVRFDDVPGLGWAGTPPLTGSEERSRRSSGQRSC